MHAPQISPHFQLSDIPVPMVYAAHRIIRDDPALESQQGQALRLLLYVFERDEAVKLLRAG